MAGSNRCQVHILWLRTCSQTKEKCASRSDFSSESALAELLVSGAGCPCTDSICVSSTDTATVHESMIE